MIVTKFGGTSVGSAQRIQEVVAIVSKSREKETKLVVVLSAMSAVTNGLVAAADRAVEGDYPAAQALVNSMRAKHEEAVLDLFKTESMYHCIMHELDPLFHKLEVVLRGISYLGELSARSLDTVSSFGELLSSKLVFEYAKSVGLECQWVDARKVITTDDTFGRANPVWNVIEQRSKEIMLPLLNSGQTVITQGFIGATATNVGTTLGRGGSDFSASIFGVALDADEIQIWTDVSGMMTADPRTVAGAEVIPEVTFQEASELAYFGAKVLHPYTIVPAVDKNIPVRILNTMHPEHPGTLIKREIETTEDICGIASKKNLIVILIHSPSMFQSHGFLADVFQVFHGHKIPIDLVATSEVHIALTIDQTEKLADILNDLERYGVVSSIENVASVTTVGRGFTKQPGIANRVFSAVKDINILMVSGGASDSTISVVVKSEDADIAMQAIHKEFFQSTSTSLNEPALRVAASGQR
jgi:aspartate kinase